MNFILPDKDGNPQFIGKEDPNNPPVKPREGSKMECPVCHGMFDYLLGVDTPDGGRMGCEMDWKPSQKGVDTNNEYNKDQEII